MTRQSDDVDTFFEGRINHHFGRSESAEIDHFHARIAQQPGDRKSAGLVLIEAKNREQNSDRSLGCHQAGGSI
jgi:hypothetical protein